MTRDIMFQELSSPRGKSRPMESLDPCPRSVPENMEIESIFKELCDTREYVSVVAECATSLIARLTGEGFGLKGKDGEDISRGLYQDFRIQLEMIREAASTIRFCLEKL